MNELMEYLSGEFSKLSDSLNVGNQLVAWGYDVVGYMPAAVDTSGIYGPMVQAVGAFAGYFYILDYFINLPLFAAAVEIILIIEAALLLPRVWRFARSFIT